MNRSAAFDTDEELRAHLAAIIDSSDDAIISKDLDAIIRSWNAGAERLYGYTAEEAIGQPVTMLVPEDQADEIPAIMDRLRRGERVDHFETVRKAKDGRRLNISLTVSPIRNSQGNITGASAVGRDITHRKRVEQVLAAELGDHKRLQEISCRLIPTDDIQTLYEELIGAAIDIMQADRGTIQSLDCETGELCLLEAKGMPPQVWDIFARVSPDAHTSCAVALKRGERVIVDYVTDERVAGTEDARVHLDVGIRAAISTPLITRSGQLVGMLTTHWNQPGQLPEQRLYLLDILARQAADLIERAQAEQALRESERRERERADELAALMDSVPAVVFQAHDPEGRRITGSRKAHELLRVPLKGNLSRSAEVSERPQHFRVFQDGVEVPPEQLPVQRAAAGKRMYDQELEVRFDDGTVSYLFGNAVPVCDEHGNARGSLAAMIDITERKRFEQALCEADRRKDEFLATLAHELRNPLAAIRMAMGVLGSGDDGPAQAREMIAVIERQSLHLVHLIDDLLDVSRISQGKIELKRRSEDVAEVVKHVVDDVRPVCEDKGVELSMTLPERPVTVEVDSVRFAQVINNLLHNACKFTEPGGTVRVIVERQGQEAVVRVADTGMGMPREQLGRIFDMFAQVESPHRHGATGLGIGLSLAKSLIELHGGTIEASSDGPGKGSEFVVRMPTIGVEATAAGGEDDRRMQSERQATGKRIVAADDNPDALHTMALMLRMKGHEVETAADGAEALEKTRVHRPDIVLLDIGMPGMDGYEVARRIRQEPWGREMLLVAMTGWGQERDKQLAQEAGFDTHLTKPVDSDVLQQLIVERGKNGTAAQRPSATSQARAATRWSR